MALAICPGAPLGATGIERLGPGPVEPRPQRGEAPGCSDRRGFRQQRRVGSGQPKLAGPHGLDPLLHRRGATVVAVESAIRLSRNRRAKAIRCCTSNCHSSWACGWAWEGGAKRQANSVNELLVDNPREWMNVGTRNRRTLGKVPGLGLAWPSPARNDRRTPGGAATEQDSPIDATTRAEAAPTATEGADSAQKTSEPLACPGRARPDVCHSDGAVVQPETFWRSAQSAPGDA